ncbi:MAG: 4-alpha-glucanotransferase, partial [Pseudomonadota bacterium]
MPRARSAAQHRRRSLDRLAQIHGIERSYTDVWKKRRVVSAASQRALLQAMGVPCEDDAEVDASLRLAERAAWEEVLPPVIMTREPKPSVMLTLPSSFTRRVAWAVRTETGRTVAGEFDRHDLEVLQEAQVDGAHYRRCRVELPPLPLGYHVLELSAEVTATITLIVAPNRVFGVADLGESDKLWGVTAPLYGLRSESNWGVGDFHDLGDLAKLCGGFGAAFVGINPIHAQYPASPARFSPYAPSSRRFLNTLLVAIDQVPELAYCDRARALLREPAFHSLLGNTRAAEMVDYEGVARLKLEVLELLFETLRADPEGPRWLAFEGFRREAGSDLEHHALFDALSAHFRERDPDLTSWRSWPLTYQDPQSEEVVRFAQTHLER